MTTKLDPNKIIHILNQSAENLDQETLAGLQRARAQALQKQATKVHVLQFAGHPWTGQLTPHTIQQWFAVALLALALAAGAGYLWQENHHQHIIELDEQILTDELPLEIFID
jgi:hypothetical protein